MSVISYTKARIDALLAGAVALSTTTPLAGTTAGFAGTANTAARGDHQHPLPPAKPAVLGSAGSGVSSMVAIPGSNAGSTLNRANFGPLWISTISRAPLAASVIGVYVSGAAGSGGVIRFALYKADAVGLIDYSNKLFESGTISSTTTGFKSAAYTTPIPEGLYWLGVVGQVNVTGLQILTAAHGMAIQNPSNHAQTFGALYIDGVSGTFPTSGGNVNGDIAPNLLYTAA